MTLFLAIFQLITSSAECRTGYISTYICCKVISCQEVASSGITNVCSVSSCHVCAIYPKMPLISLYLCQFNSDLYET